MLIINSAIFLSGLGEVDFAVASVVVKKCLRQTLKRGAYKVCTDKGRCFIGKYASCHGWSLLLEHGRRPTRISTKTPCVDLKNVTELNSKEASCKNVSPKNKLVNKMRGRPTFLGQKLDTLVQKFLRATRYEGGVVSTQTALATAKALLKRYLLLEKENLVLSAAWTKSLFRRMGFVLRRKITAKVLIPEGALKETESIFHHQIVNYVGR